MKAHSASTTRFEDAHWPARAQRYGVLGTPTVSLPNLSERFGIDLFAKLELTNPTGSIKDRPAIAMVEAAVSSGRIKRGDTVIESSSGNMAVALAMACVRNGLSFIGVVEPTLDDATVRRLQLLGAEIIVARAGPDETPLAARLRTVRERSDDGSVTWLNQYEDLAAVDVHRHWTFPELLEQLGRAPDILIVGVSTCATALGAKLFLEENSLPTGLLLVDVKGSALFGGQVGERSVPGLGAGVMTPFSRDLAQENVVRVDSALAWRWTRILAEKEGILAGGSSGATLAALALAIDQGMHARADLVVAAVFPDSGWRYDIRSQD